MRNEGAAVSRHAPHRCEQLAHRRNDHVTLASNVDSREPHQPSFFHNSVPPSLGAGTHALACPFEDAACASTVRALSLGRGRQSSAQRFTFGTAGGDTSPGNLSHLSRSHWWLAASRVLGQGKKSWPASAETTRLRVPKSLSPQAPLHTTFPLGLGPSWWTPGLSCQPLIVTSFKFGGAAISQATKGAAGGYRIVRDNQRWRCGRRPDGQYRVAVTGRIVRWTASGYLLIRHHGRSSLAPFHK